MGNCIIGRRSNSSSIYKFYTQNNTLITDITISGLANAYYYTKNGGAKQRVGGRIYFINANIEEGTGDKFYVYDIAGPVSGKTWASNTSSIPTVQDTTEADAIGHGRINTETVTSKNYGGTAWTYISSLNSSSYQDCNDWFIGSRLEYDVLRKSEILQATTCFSKSGGSYIWSSVESSYATANSWNWAYYAQCWSYDTKSNSYCVLPLQVL